MSHGFIEITFGKLFEVFTENRYINTYKALQ